MRKQKLWLASLTLLIVFLGVFVVLKPHTVSADGFTDGSGFPQLNAVSCLSSSDCVSV